MRYLSLIVKNSLRNRRRAFLTISSLAISLCLLGVLVAIYFALFFGSAPKAQARRVVSRHKVSITFPLPYYYGAKIEGIKGVEAVLPWQWYGGAYKDARDQRNFFPRLAVEPEKLFKVFTDIQLPEDQKQAFLRDRGAVIVGESLAKAQGFKLGDRIQVKGDIFPVDLDVVVRGIYASSENTNEDTMYFHYEYLRQAMPGRRVADSTGTFTFLAATPEDVPRISKEVDAMFANSTAPTRTESEYAFGLSFLSFLGNIKLILMSICIAVTFTIVLIAANTMAMSTRERVKEVGVLKTLGFTKGAVLWLVLGEAALLSAVGGFVGLMLAQGLCAVVRNGPTMLDQTKSLTIAPPLFMLLLSISVLIGLISSLIPAWSAARTPILDALRFTD